MNSIHLRSNGNHVEIRIFFQKKAAFESGMNSANFRFFAGNIFVTDFGFLQYFGVQIGFPSRISFTMCNFSLRQSKHRFHLMGNIELGRFNGTALTGYNKERIILLYSDRSQIGRGFHQIGHISAKSLNSVWTGIQRIQKLVGRFFIEYPFREFFGRKYDLQPGSSSLSSLSISEMYSLSKTRSVSFS